MKLLRELLLWTVLLRTGNGFFNDEEPTSVVGDVTVNELLEHDAPIGIPCCDCLES